MQPGGFCKAKSWSQSPSVLILTLIDLPRPKHKYLEAGRYWQGREQQKKGCIQAGSAAGKAPVRIKFPSNQRESLTPTETQTAGSAGSRPVGASEADDGDEFWVHPGGFCKLNHT